VRRFAPFLLLTAAAYSGCGGDLGVGPKSGVPLDHGPWSYVLSSINGNAPPALVNRTTDAFGRVDYYMVSSTLKLDGPEFTLDYSIAQTRAASIPSTTTGVALADHGTWSVVDSALTLTYDDGTKDAGRLPSHECGVIAFAARMADGMPLNYVYRNPATPKGQVRVTPDTIPIVAALGELTANPGGDPTCTGPPWLWSSSDVSIATVDSLGRVRGIAPGTATITVTAKYHSDVSDKAIVIVFPRG
jgi:hypothetical protein